MDSRPASALAMAIALLAVIADRVTAQEALERSALERAAIAFVEALERRDFEAAVGRFDSTMSAVMSAAQLQESWDTVEARVGPFREWTGTTQGHVQGYEYVLVASAFRDMILDIRVVFDADARIAGLFFQPHRDDDDAEQPELPEGLREQDLTIGQGEWALPGTLTVPAAGGPFPAVVLVHGSGPNDRDETVGANKPFRDLAWGLAGRNVAVLRYEKRTRQYRDRLMNNTVGFTVDDETVEDAVAAVEQLRYVDGIDPDRIVVLGHSLGGMLAPRIGMRDQAIAGLVIMAGAARPLPDLIVDQIHYLAELDSAVTGSERARLEQIEQEAARVLRLTDADSLSTERLLGAHPSYWLDLADYDPVAMATGLLMPMLILHAGRDYQVTSADYARWEAAFASDSRVTLMSYPTLNHLFMTGAGPSQPSEYGIPGHVSDDVIHDIAAWVLALAPMR